MAEWSKLQLESSEPGFHEAVLPGTTFVAGTQLDFVPLADLLVSGLQLFHSRLILGAAFGCLAVEADPANAQYLREMVEPSRFDLVQDDYLFAFCISAVALPIRA